MKYRLLTPGPTLMPQDVKLALSKEMIHHRKEEFKTILDDVEEKLKILFGTKEEVIILSCSGTGGMQAALFNLFSPGEEVIVVEGGKFGKRWTEMAQKRGLSIATLEVEWGKAADPEKIEAVIQSHPQCKGLLLQYSETSTGVLHPIKEIGEILKDRDILLVVDGISGVGISPCPMDKWHIDCLISGSQKGFMIPPGLAFIALSEKAWEKTKQVKNECFYFNLQGEREKMLKGQTLFTSSVALIRALQASLKFFFSPSPDRVYRNQWALTQMTRTAISSLGLKCLAEKHYTWGLTSVCVPSGVSPRQILNICSHEFNLYLAGGQDKLKEKIIRIGHMGDVDVGDILMAVSAISYCLKKLLPHFEPTNKDFMERGFHAYVEAIQRGYPTQ